MILDYCGRKTHANGTSEFRRLLVELVDVQDAYMILIADSGAFLQTLDTGGSAYRIERHDGWGDGNYLHVENDVSLDDAVELFEAFFEGDRKTFSRFKWVHGTYTPP